MKSTSAGFLTVIGALLISAVSSHAVDTRDTALLTQPAIGAKTIAFSAQYDGNVDVYLVPAAGGVPSG